MSDQPEWTCSCGGTMRHPDAEHGEFLCSQPPRALGWHVISGENLLSLLRRCADGESPDAVFAEAWANADHERIFPEGIDTGGILDV